MAATSPGNATLPSLRPLQTSTLPKTASRHLDREIKVKVRDSHSIQVAGMSKLVVPTCASRSVIFQKYSGNRRVRSITSIKV
ncbi:hypothetical protein DL95DRAFT_152628 [Leptodontidium sp. 2 PMI_412]|nr:hypothetical protein DL95DRAFT_152628 [Leptodontidium sp. 2 PMI_412]